MTTGVFVAVEGVTDQPFAERIVAATGLHVDRVIVFEGHGNLDPHVNRWCERSNRRPMLVLRDLDPTLGADCSPGLVDRLAGPGPRSTTTLVRIAERELESWLLADREAVALYFHVRAASVPTIPDAEPDPKRALIDLCRSSAARSIRSGMVPKPDSGRAVGPEFTGLVIGFGSTVWNVERARTVSPSLDRAMTALERLAATGE